MKIAKIVDVKKIEIDNIDKSVNCQDDEVVVNIKACGICGTDTHIFSHGRADVQFPRVLGHEIAGKVVKIGSKVTKIKVGDRIAVDPVVSCGTCIHCINNHPNVCNTAKCIGVQVDGGMQDFFVTKENRAHIVPDDMPWELAALIEPYSVGANVVYKSNAKKGQNAVVFGAGPIGLVVTEALKANEVKVIVVDIMDTRLELARKFGADIVINSKNEDLYSVVSEHFDGSIDIIVNAVGSAMLLTEAVKLATPLTKIVELGFDSNKADISPVDITKREINIIGSRMNCNRFPTVIEWYRKGLINPKNLLTKVYKFEDVQKAFEDLISDPINNIKLVIKY